jgi:RNA recognition motif. (a.k.a. RRM, RBD, or RNP domain)
MSGTTPDDVSAIFNHCGRILQKGFSALSVEERPVIMITYENQAGAEAAVRSFHGQAADGSVLAVRILQDINAAAGAQLSEEAREQLEDVRVQMSTGV